MSDLNLVVKLLVEDIVFKYQPSGKTKEIEFIDLYICGIKVIVAGTLLDKYQYRAQDNQKWKLAMNSNQFDNNKDNNSTIDVLKKADLSSIVKTDENNGNDE